jgi:DegV family protein with EDD domain
MKIAECEEAGMSFAEVIENVERYIEEQNTYFVLESLETLHKNGRLTGIKALVAEVLNIKPIMGSTPEGSIRQLGKARGINKALVKMVDEIARDVKDSTEKILIITHCNCLERAIHVKEMILSKINLRDIIILDTRGISSMYANDGGIIVVV